MSVRVNRPDRGTVFFLTGPWPACRLDGCVDIAMTLCPDRGDAELVEAAQRGERGALDAFVRRHDRWVRGVVYSNLGNASIVDDVVQHVWTNVWQQIGTLVDSQRWRGWLYRMAKNAAIDAGQKAARIRRRTNPLLSDDVAAAGEATPLRGAIQSEQLRTVLDAVAGLPVIYREPFVLRHIEDWSYEQIGEALSLPVDTVETRLVRARRLLREALAGRVG